MDRPRSASSGAGSRRSGRSHRGGGTGSEHSQSGGGSHKSSRPKVCRNCGQHHSHHEPHLYNYKNEVDEDLMCQICLQPFVSPTDTPCGHTFCHACLNAYLRVNPMCPLDRKPVNEMTISPSNLVLKRLLDKLLVTCPNADSCEEVLQRGTLDDHLKYRCSGTMVACQYAGAGCEYRGPTKSMNKHRAECKFKEEGITRLPVLEGEVSHVEIPRTNQNLGITIVGGADTPLRCVVVQEVYADGLIAQDGRLQPGDQIIEINGIDMTCASHSQVCAALRKMSSVLRLGVYRERIEKYGIQQQNVKTQGQKAEQQRPPKPPTTSKVTNGISSKTQLATTNGNSTNEELLTVTLERQTGRPLGIRLSGSCSDKGIFIVDIQEGSSTALDGRLQKLDRILFINGQDVRHCRLAQASALIQNNDKVSIIVARSTTCSSKCDNPENGASTEHGNDHDFSRDQLDGGCISHQRSKSAPAINQNKHKHNQQDDESCFEGLDEDKLSEDENSESDGENDSQKPNNGHQRGNKSQEDLHLYDVPQGEDYMAIYETLDRVKKQSHDMKNKSHSMEALETPTPSLKSFEFPDVSTSDKDKNGAVHNHHHLHPKGTMATSEAAAAAPDLPRRRHRSKPQNGNSTNNHEHHELERRTEARRSLHEMQYVPKNEDFVDGNKGLSPSNGSSRAMAAFLKKALRIEGPQLQQRTVAIKKNVRESLGMRIGGGIGSNEGDTPIYIANIHPHGCIGKSKQMKKGDLLLSVDDVSLCGLTHTQAVATLKATINRAQVMLGVMDGPETSFGASNFIPSWMYWQKLPRTLQYPKTVILHRRENASWGFSIVGGADGGGGRPHEPIHVLFVVPDSPAAKDAKIKCGDRLLAVDGHSLESIPHSLAVSMLKQTSTRVVLEVVSWMGTEI